MSPGRVAPAIAAAALLAAAPPSAGAQRSRARLEGTFVLGGRVTVAVHVTAEHRGQRVARAWSFIPLCPAGFCRRVRLMRQRAGGVDMLTLHRVAPGDYQGGGRFGAPLVCDGQTFPNGETVRFTIIVRIAAAAASAGGLIATRIKAAYTNRVRVNHTPCVFPPSYDSAVYSGTLQTTTPAAIAPAPTTPAAGTATAAGAPGRIPQRRLSAPPGHGLSSFPGGLSSRSPAGS